jgi:ligand-binding SRPBCC domain-containing protein
LARNVDAHVQSASETGERAVAGKMSGLLDLHDEVTWEARHFGVRQSLTSQITAYDRPRYFHDRMIRGIFKSLEHDHEFIEIDDGQTLMIDVLRFEVPGGSIGKLLGQYVIGPHLARFLQHRGKELKRIAESEQWTQFVSTAN